VKRQNEDHGYLADKHSHFVCKSIVILPVEDTKTEPVLLAHRLLFAEK